MKQVYKRIQVKKLIDLLDSNLYCEISDSGFEEEIWQEVLNNKVLSREALEMLFHVLKDFHCEFISVYDSRYAKMGVYLKNFENIKEKRGEKLNDSTQRYFFSFD